ncbi:hypothetical protein CEUSTIGMA_g6084.t1 [Chlamydomonas eustigma]|uniref:RING-type domain-containing protein n=1 Tax=Chlamydomonas eustigma TaxID=1157962 RepID=A0A250X6H2_9CHLO|nr:hypothetical protein CEUSTIGMA_g6084.t1 [Chlamydomonas eustigma]|eukprot:GAX78646.1 hypothetical protein CEUSTIGMA_g6084.t1 [Chlamydomonas eustigma]
MQNSTPTLPSPFPPFPHPTSPPNVNSFGSQVNSTTILVYAFGIMGGMLLISGMLYIQPILTRCRGGAHPEVSLRTVRAAGIRQFKEEDGVPAEVIATLKLRTFIKLDPAAMTEESCTEAPARNSPLSVVKQGSKAELIVGCEAGGDGRSSSDGIQGVKIRGHDRESDVHIPGQVQAACLQERYGGEVSEGFGGSANAGGKDNFILSHDSVNKLPAIRSTESVSNEQHDSPVELVLNEPRTKSLSRDAPHAAESAVAIVVGDSALDAGTTADNNTLESTTTSSPAAAVQLETAADSDTTCTICLIEYENGDILRQLPCKHEFHKDCIDSWMIFHHTCPICRKELVQQTVPPATNQSYEHQSVQVAAATSDAGAAGAANAPSNNIERTTFYYW